MVETEVKKISEIARELEIPPDKFLSESVEVFLKKELRRVQVEIYHLCGKYKVDKSSDIDEKYCRGELEEKDSWEDYFKLDHLEYRRKKVLRALEELNVPY